MKTITMAANAAFSRTMSIFGGAGGHAAVAAFKAAPHHGPGRKTLYTRHKGIDNHRINYGEHPTFGLRQRTRFTARMDAKVMARTDAMAMRRAKELARKKSRRA